MIRLHESEAYEPPVVSHPAKVHSGRGFRTLGGEGSRRGLEILETQAYITVLFKAYAGRFHRNVNKYKYRECLFSDGNVPCHFPGRLLDAAA